MIEKITGSIFESLADDPAEAMQLRIKSTLMHAIIDFVEDEGFTQAAAAKMMNVQKTCVADVCVGRVDKLSIETLIGMAARLGLDPLQMQ